MPDVKFLRATDFKKKFTSLVTKTDKEVLIRWVVVCARRVLPYFEKKYHKDKRPRVALETAKKWLKGGYAKVPFKEIRKASLDAHAAARAAPENSQARFAARACGQAVATVHVKTHALGPVYYIGKFKPKEIEWQMKLLEKFAA
ncbi:MAG: hypothetical protein Q7R70_00825 [Candidatus Diapherotrites archaeon]|nr:hypothetical protein [Candidatus Diapherotrites archaeon]